MTGFLRRTIGATTASTGRKVKRLFGFRNDENDPREATMTETEKVEYQKMRGGGKKTQRRRLKKQKGAKKTQKRKLKIHH